MTSSSVFRAPEDQVAFFDAYDATLRKLWPVPFEEIDLVGRFGSTHVVASGPTKGAALVLLHGFMTTLTMWAPNIADLTKDYRVFAIDTMGQPSKSLPDEPIGQIDDLVEWLDSTLDGLHLDRVFVAGMSTGAWIALNYAMARPDRVAKLVLLSPAASFQPLVKRFWVWAIFSGVVRTRRMMDAFMRWMGLDAAAGDEVITGVLDLMWIGGTHYRMQPETRRVMPDVFSDDELRELKMPVLLLIGEHEAIYDSAKALERARELVPDIDGELVQDCSHDMSMTKHETVDRRILAFLHHS